MKEYSAEVWRKQRNCKEQHACSIISRLPRGVWELGPTTLLGTYRTGGGDVRFRFQCSECGKESGDVSNRDARAFRDQGVPLVWHRESAPNVYMPCTYQGCTAPRTELHHFAPTNTFGYDADNWPVLALCHKHHEQWHKTMDGYRWNAKRVAS